MNQQNVRAPLRRLRQRVRRLIRPARFGALRRTQPLSNDFGFDRGTPVDRYYIERFLERYRSDIRGRVLEVKEPMYARQFGTQVERCDILDIDVTNRRATVVADLADGEGLPADCFDCFILTQTLHCIYRVDAALRQAHRVLRVGGVLLVTVPTVSRLSYLPELSPDYWRFTAAACSRMFADVFGPDDISVRAHGNVLTCIAFMTGLSAEELTRPELDADDPLFPLLVTVRAVKR